MIPGTKRLDEMTHEELIDLQASHTYLHYLKH